MADLHAVEPGRLAIVGLADDVLEPVAEMTRIEQNRLVGESGEELVGLIDEGLIRDAAGHLLIDDQRIGGLERVADAVRAAPHRWRRFAC